MLKANRKCHVCQKVSGALCCSRCRSAYYCGKDCQKNDWKNGHKNACTATRSQPASSIYQAKTTLSYKEQDEIVIWCCCSNTTDKLEKNKKDNEIIGFNLLIKNFSDGSVKIATKNILLTVKDETRRRKTSSSEILEIEGEKNEKETSQTLNLESKNSVVIRVEFELNEINSKNLNIANTTTQALNLCQLLEIPIKAEHKGLFNLPLNLE